MFGLILLIGSTIAVARMAEADRGEGLKWGGIMFVVGFLSMLIPIPFLPMLVAIGVVFAAMTASKKTFY